MRRVFLPGMSITTAQHGGPVPPQLSLLLEQEPAQACEPVQRARRSRGGEPALVVTPNLHSQTHPLATEKRRLLPKTKEQS